MADVHHNCGVAAVSVKKGSSSSTVELLYKLLLSMQARGQLSAGITTFDPDRSKLLKTYRDIGLVNDVFRTKKKDEFRKIVEEYSGTKGIGHVRYATCGKDDKSYAQPFERPHGRKWKWFSFCFNGNIANFKKLRDRIKKDWDYQIIYDTDTEIIMDYIAKFHHTHRKPGLKQLFSHLAKLFDGCYNIAYIDGQGCLVVTRDPLGFRPMSYGYKDGDLVVASETSALISIGARRIRDLPPGHMLLAQNGSVKIIRYADTNKIRRCMFEWVYFATVSSRIDKRSVYLARAALGRSLARREKEKTDKKSIAIHVPDSSKPIGDAFAYELGIPSMEGLIRNRFVGRTFIESDDRQEKVKDKFYVIRDVVKDKKVFLIDDSIVRGNTMKELVRFIRKSGKASEIHVRIACPPVMAPCFYGIDMSTVSELFARRYAEPRDMKAGLLPQKVLDKMAEDLGADSLVYNSIPDLIGSVGFSKDELCLACLNTDYPTRWGTMLYKRAASSNACDVKRTYE